MYTVRTLMNLVRLAENQPQKQVQERLRENILDNGGYKLEELTIDNTPVKNEKDQEDCH